MGNTFAITHVTPTQVRQYQQIQSDYASYAPVSTAANAIRETNAQLKVPRPKTVTEDISTEKRELVGIRNRPSLLVLQVALATVVLCLLVYLAVPAQYAHGVALLVLSVGIAVGIFLTK